MAAPPPFDPTSPLLPAVMVGLTARQIGQADVVIDWNATMLHALWAGATPPTRAARAEAMVGVAVYDAVDGARPSYDFYPVPGLTAAPARDASPEAAAVAAAYTVLTGLFPDQQAMFDAEYGATLPGNPRDRPTADGVAWGQAVGRAVLAWRGQDGANAPSDYQPAPPGGPAGAYELTPPAFKSALDPQWGQVTPWVMSSGSQFLPPAPPALDSAQYATDFNKTKSLGAVNSTTRTPDQTLYAHFWSDLPGNSVTPPGHWDEIAENVALQRHLSLVENARLFGLLNVGLADAAIACWDAKYVYNFWRPVTAIEDPRAGQINPATSSDPSWLPLWNTPNFPSYTSGHSTFSGTAAVILTALFGDATRFTVGSDDMLSYGRTFTSFGQAAIEAGESRIMGGIHFEFDNTAGLAAGAALGSLVIHRLLVHGGTPGTGGAGDVLDRLLQPVATALLTRGSIPPAGAGGPGAATAAAKGMVESFFVQDLVRGLDPALWGGRASAGDLLALLQADALAFELVTSAL